jgi:hypothetical protein
METESLRQFFVQFHENQFSSSQFDPKWFWRRCISLRITGYFGLRPSSAILKTSEHDVSENGSESSSDRGQLFLRDSTE